MSIGNSHKKFGCKVEGCARRFSTEEGMHDHAQVVHGVTRPAPKRGKDAIVDVDPICVECGGVAKLVDGQTIYPHRRDLFHKKFYLCRCGAYCGCHPDTTVPLGYPAGPVTRQARSAAHAVFDPLWKTGSMTRRNAYLWLASKMGMDRDACHIGMMTEEQAWQVVKLVKALPKAEPL